MANRRGGPALLLLGLFLFLMKGALSRADDIVAAGRPMSGGQILVSKRGKFRLGFFQPDNSTQRWYLGIWYNQIPLRTNVWVANRETPITNPESSQLCIASDGNMVLLDHRKSSPVWSTNLTRTSANRSTSTVGVILDSGNLVLADASNASAVLWQSFDHFGDTWLPGGKLGRNKRTGEVTRLTAWKGYDDPAPSPFSLSLDPRGTSQYLLSWDGGDGGAPHQYWSSGNWTGRSFAEVPEMTASDAAPVSRYTFGYVDGVDESYFVYDVRDDDEAAPVTRFQVDVTGQIKFLTWVQAAGGWVLFWAEPKARCDVYALCGAFSVCVEDDDTSCGCLRGFRERRPDQWRQGDRASGCARNTDLQHCTAARQAGVQQRNDDDRFYTMSDVRLPSDAQSTASSSARECELACLGNCSCTAYSYNGSSCSLWYGDLINLQDTTGGAGTGGDGGSSISIRLAASEFSSGAAGSSKKKLVVGLVVVAAVVAVTALLTLFVVRKNRRIKALRTVEGSLTAFTYRDLQSVTRNFSEKLGGGAFGSVFKGALPDPNATLVAVKKLEGVRQGEKQFRAEVSTIGTVQHVNLIRLLGFCSESTRRRLLVYEHMPNGSLDRHLFAGSTVLSWDARYRIALGVARGLDYLHDKCRDCIIHCDVKPENVLLDAAFAPKVADFGLAKLMGRDFSRVLTTMRGTVGYLAPEWIAGTPVTAKADVFSYGMMLFELVSGQRNVDQLRTEDGAIDFFPATAAGLLLAGGDLRSAVDARLHGDANLAEVETACKVACWCVQDDESARPTMGMVVQVLEGLVEVNVPPIPRSLKVLAAPSKYINFFSGLPST